MHQNLLNETSAQSCSYLKKQEQTVLILGLRIEFLLCRDSSEVPGQEIDE